MTDSPLLRVDNLATHFTITDNGRKRVLKAVDGVSFEVGRGETVGIVGESGSGKSTVARTIMGLEPAASGSILFDGIDLTTLGARAYRGQRRRIQMVFQDPFASLNPRMRIGEIVAEPLLVHDGMRLRAGIAEARELLERVGLPADSVERYPHEFSGGQRQRIGIARALASKPDLMIADEPVSALDVSIQAQLLNLMKDLQRDLGLSILFISHDLNVVRYMCTRTVVMYHGKVVEYGATDDLWTDPQHDYTRTLLSAIPHLARSAG